MEKKGISLNKMFRRGSWYSDNYMFIEQIMDVCLKQYFLENGVEVVLIHPDSEEGLGYPSNNPSHPDHPNSPILTTAVHNFTVVRSNNTVVSLRPPPSPTYHLLYSVCLLY